MPKLDAALIDHDVADFDTWAKHFADHAPARRKAGITSERVYRGADDRAKVVVVLGYESADEARRFFDSADLRETMQRAGVTGAPRVTFSESVKSAEVTDRPLPAIAVRHQVQDYEAWRAVYDSLESLRSSFGIMGDAVHRTGDRGDEVIVFHQAETREELENFLASAELRQAMSRAGVAGPREVTFLTSGVDIPPATPAEGAAPVPDPSHIMQVGMGFFGTKTLLSAVELGLFTRLADGPLTGAEIADALQLHARSVPDFPDALVALGFLEREGSGDDAKYCNTLDSGVFLDRTSPHYIGGILEMANDRLYGFWDTLTDALKTGRPQSETKDGGEPIFAKLYAQPEKLEQFMNAMAGISAGNFAAFAEKFDFSSYESLCDVGGATGQLSCMVAAAQPHLSCKSFDLPPVEPIAQRNIESAGLADRVEAVAGDFFVDELPRADVITMGMILHDWNLEQKKMLIRKAYDALPEGGAFVAIESIIDDERRENAFGLLMSLNMLIEFGADGGFDFTAADFDGWCREAGFQRTEVIPLAGPSSAVVAYK